MSFGGFLFPTGFGGVVAAVKEKVGSVLLPPKPKTPPTKAGQQYTSPIGPPVPAAPATPEPTKPQRPGQEFVQAVVTAYNSIPVLPDIPVSGPTKPAQVNQAPSNPQSTPSKPPGAQSGPGANGVLPLIIAAAIVGAGLLFVLFGRKRGRVASGRGYRSIGGV